MKPVYRDLIVLRRKLSILEDLLRRRNNDDRKLERFGISEIWELEVRDKHGKIKERRVIK